ncbi:GDSL esterase/lipase At4g10955 isoform X2 [Amborella trichopoda]|uniref:Uncharacterized protein n=2 Tax=Amborella trichopoda TaxID=13333 RepID=W1Q071_AMBTC|nr:GDSL esterase/lipase At4g10955 isoform X2 [Amborella trichopoda]XP_011626311.1 GDSL esterase/lipase At4g10955 isoform X2 [Amborella trichopoda]XP_011626312.1 GDSL esterase/lipase At4g10955 isoform X2 [Amborella trichopoda]XP_020527938.1 GDSL esterase/lipase At4g10955 isoform X2 [Amborella trichopoda]XP_020527939.1 GDSL esterase/lipase At4g10955 isoform X2 [Amborella trichopoda]XP_020527940.1 GDSL esterase/lipase At4g10955 isoform X2 [Amborella trichopoda]XP_020527941.1 GDSL esterase/lipase|eukprot:XP_006852651.1 GDSL esterase/lipase At4g10955 isoform X2 [Amborella trichopoda]
MASEQEQFGLCGPKHLTAYIDWSNPDHRRSVAASLVKGVYILQRDRQQNRSGHEALAPQWWTSLGFDLLRFLIDDADSSIFGAIYVRKYKENNAPNIVVAFRGTIPQGESFQRDFKLNLEILKNELHRTSRFEHSIQVVRSLVCHDQSLWLAGHSLGSALAMLVGRTMVESGLFLETYLFNPPFSSIPIDRIKNRRVREGLMIASSFVTAGLAVVLKKKSGGAKHAFLALEKWFPNLFVNPNDPICSAYIGYFEHRRKMEEIGASKIERLATQNSIGDLVSGAFGRESKPSHLVPSANLTVNLDHSKDFKSAHGIQQWWQPDLRFECTCHKHK